MGGLDPDGNERAIALAEDGSVIVTNNGSSEGGITEAQVTSAIESATNIDGIEAGLSALLQEGTPIDGQSLETGGSKALGWLSSLRKLISDRLPTLGAKSSAGSLSFTPATDASFILGTSANFTGRQGIRAFRASANFTRPADTNAYSVNDAITNSISSPTVLSADLSSFDGVNNGFICITNARVISDANQSTLPLVNLIIFNQAFTASADNSALSITDAVAQSGGIIIPCLNTYNLGANSRCVSDNGQWIIQLGASSTSIFFTLQAANAYTPVSGERFDVVIDGFVL